MNFNKAIKELDAENAEGEMYQPIISLEVQTDASDALLMS